MKFKSAGGPAFEKEFIIRFSKAEDQATVFTEIKSCMKLLVNHSEFELERTIERDGYVIGIEGKVPIGLLKINANSRSRNTPSLIISEQKRVNMPNTEKKDD